MNTPRTSRESARCPGSGCVIAKPEHTDVVECPPCGRLVRIRTQPGRIPSHGTTVTKGSEAHQERLRFARIYDLRHAEETARREVP